MKPGSHIQRALILALVAAGNVFGSGWTQYRGSNHDGVSTEPIRLNWAEAPPRTLWKVPLPNGLSSFSLADGRAFTMGARREQGVFTEFCIALDANTGSQLWSSAVGPAGYPNGGVGPDDGTRATPSIDGDRIYAFGAYLDLVCFQADTGQEVWRHNLREEFGGFVIPWQNAASPLIVGELVLVNGNGRPGEHLLAFRKSDGALAWKTGSDGMTQASPVRATIEGLDQAIFFAQSGLVSVAPETGQVLWRVPIPYNGTSVAASPVVVGDTVYASRAYPTRAGALVVRVEENNGSFSATKVWEKPNQLMNHWATPVHYNGYYYGMYGQSSLNLRAVDASNGETKWTETGFGYGSVTRVNDKLLVLGEDGLLALVDTNPEAYTELARLQPLEGRTWNNPAVSDGRIYIRSTTEAVALDVSLVQAALPPLRIAIDLSEPSGLTLSVSSVDGAALDQTQAEKIGVAFSDSLAPETAWQPLTGTPEVANGKVSYTGAVPSTNTRYYRAQQKP